MKACTVDGCDRAHRAKGYCASHYNSILAPDRHTVTRACDECGETYTTTRTNGRYCSLTCRDAKRWRDVVARKVVVGPLPWVDATQCDPATPPQARVREWVAGPCVWCGAHFVAEVQGTPSRHCSRRCLRKAGKLRRRAREAGASGTYTWSEVTHVWITLGRVCAYCAQPVSNGDLEPDHVIPLSKGGSNSLTNVVPSCRSCNCDKRDLTLSDWYADRVRRRLPPVHLDARVTHLTTAMLAAA